jgi:hypothetical protein
MLVMDMQYTPTVAQVFERDLSDFDLSVRKPGHSTLVRANLIPILCFDVRQQHQVQGFAIEPLDVRFSHQQNLVNLTDGRNLFGEPADFRYGNILLNVSGGIWSDSYRSASMDMAVKLRPPLERPHDRRFRGRCITIRSLGARRDGDPLTHILIGKATPQIARARELFDRNVRHSRLQFVDHSLVNVVSCGEYSRHYLSLKSKQSGG